jgi:hypothetical protein
MKVIKTMVSVSILYLLVFVGSLEADQVHGRIIYNYMSYCAEGGFCDSVIHVGITGSPDWYRILHPPTPHAYASLRKFCDTIEWCQRHGKDVTIKYGYGEVGHHTGWFITGASVEGGDSPDGWKPPHLQPGAPDKPIVW